MIKSVAVISFDEMGKVLEPITSCEDVTTIAIRYNSTHEYNANHTITLSVDPESVKGLDGAPAFYLISNQENATREIEQLKNALIGVDLVIVLVELGQYTKFNATFTLPVFLKHIQILCSKIVCIAQEPFHFEGARRRLFSDICLTQLLEENIPVITIDVHKFLLAIPHDLGLQDSITVINSIVATITCDLIKHLQKTEGLEMLSKIIQSSSSSKIYLDFTKKAMKPQAQFVYTLYGRCNAPALIEWKPIEINIPVKKPTEELEKIPQKTVSSWIMSLFWRG